MELKKVLVSIINGIIWFVAMITNVSEIKLKKKANNNGSMFICIRVIFMIKNFKTDQITLDNSFGIILRPNL